MKKITIVLALMIVAIAQSQIIGSVKDSNGDILPYVNIYIKDSYRGTTSNAEGQYEIDISKAGEYAITFQFLGFKTQTQNIKIVRFPYTCLLYTSPSPRDATLSRMPSSA